MSDSMWLVKGFGIFSLIRNRDARPVSHFCKITLQMMEGFKPEGSDVYLEDCFKNLGDEGLD